jgi:hypothetical protein
MSESNSPYSFGGPESVAKPFAAIGSLFSRMGKGGKRNQAFNDTVNLHRQMESVTTEEQGKRLKMIQEHHAGMQSLATQSSTSMTPEGGMQTAASYRTPRAARKPAAQNKAAVKGTKSTPPVEGVKAVQPKRPAAKTPVKKAK